MRRAFALSLPEDAHAPLFARIAAAVVGDIRRGRLRAGDALPGSRSLATLLGVHRNTVLEAYADLEAQGWIRTEPARGTFVAPSVDPTWTATAPKAVTTTGMAFDLAPQREVGPPDPVLPEGCLALYGGAPDLRLLPTAEIARAWRRALSRGPTLLAYGDPRGEPALRRALVGLLGARRGLARGEDEILVTRGSQMGLFLAARALVEPGDVVAVESWGYAPAWAAFRAAGARLVALPVDGEGVVVDAVADLCAKEPRLRAVYVTPHHQYPTSAVLSAPRRLALLELARKRRFAIVEDDYDHEFHYEGRPVLPLASADPHGVVVYVGTLSKILAPGLRAGFVVGPRLLIDRLAALRKHVDRQGDRVGERALAELLDDGVVERHARRMSRVYRARRDVLVGLLEKELPGELVYDVPRGGMAVWARANTDVEAWLVRGLALGVAFHTARRFALDGLPRDHVRLGFASLDETELTEAVRRLLRAYRKPYGGDREASGLQAVR